VAPIRPKTVDEYIATAPENARAMLSQLRAILKKAAPKATEAIKWGAPVFEDGRILFAYKAHKSHINFMPTKPALEPFMKELSGFKTGEHTVQLPYGEPLPTVLIRRIAARRVEQMKAPGGRWRSS
jgi:uncharacterized protein YdhG (YjbR/CyaY superfamily)